MKNDGPRKGKEEEGKNASKTLNIIRYPLYSLFSSDFFFKHLIDTSYCQTPVLGLGLGVDFTFAGDNHNHNDNDNDNPHLNFVEGTVLGDKEQGVGIRDKG